MPKKRFGQHFLSNPAIIERIVAFAGVGPDDAVVEVGPGRGALTAALARRVRRVVAIEIDRDLSAALRSRLPDNVEVIEGDALKTDYLAVLPSPYHVVANLPYNIATPLLDRFTRARGRMRTASVMLQKELADRILATPGSREWSPLSVAMQYYADVEAGFVLHPGAFVPSPKVKSRLVRLTWRPEAPDAPALMAFTRQIFHARRKQLLNNLAPLAPHLDRSALAKMLHRCGVDPQTRPGNLTIDEIIAVFEAVSALPTPQSPRSEGPESPPESPRDG